MRNIVILFCAALCLAGCSPLNPSIMFKTDASYKYVTHPINPQFEYRIVPNDILDFRIYTNDGFKLVDITTTMAVNSQSLAPQYLVNVDGTAKLPTIGPTVLKDLTVREAEKLLEEKYAVYYNKPFVVIRVTNKRVLVFPGEGGKGAVVPMENENMTLVEALARAGGITTTGKAKRIKLIRNNAQNVPEAQLINLSTIAGAQQGNIVLQANDIVYVEPTRRVSQEVLAQITPVIAIITSFLVVYDLVLKKK